MAKDYTEKQACSAEAHKEGVLEGKVGFSLSAWLKDRHSKWSRIQNGPSVKCQKQNILISPPFGRGTEYWLSLYSEGRHPRSGRSVYKAVPGAEVAVLTTLDENTQQLCQEPLGSS